MTWWETFKTIFAVAWIGTLVLGLTALALAIWPIILIVAAVCSAIALTVWSADWLNL